MTHRNGYRHRDLDTRAGTIDVAIPKLRSGTYFPEWLLERRKRSEAALITVIADCCLARVFTRRMDKLVKTLGIHALSKSEVIRMAAELDEHVNQFRYRSLAEAGPFTFFAADALTMKVREGGRVANTVVLIATGVNGDGRRVHVVTDALGHRALHHYAGLHYAPPLRTVAMRVLIAALVLFVVARVRRSPRPRGRRTWLLVIAMGMLNVALAYWAMFAGLTGMSTGGATVLANAQPLLILLPAWWLFGEKPRALTVGSMLLGVVGLVSVALLSGFGTGAVLSLISAAAAMGGALLARIIHVPALTLAAWRFCIGGVVLAVAAIVVEGPPVINWNPGFVSSPCLHGRHRHRLFQRRLDR